MATGPREFFETHAPWLLEPELGVCAVGSTALAEACRRAGIEGPRVADLDVSWQLSVEEADELITRHGVGLPTTTANRERGTMAMKIGGERIEATTFRAAANGSLRERILADLSERDMTVGALAWWLAKDEILDPTGGLADWQAGRIEPCGDPAQRIAEHPVRWLRYYRRAHQWDFALAPSIRKLAPDADRLARIPPEALASEFRSALLDCASPGRWLLELHEAGLLPLVAPEIDGQFDGRPAGPVRHHPEVGQALHVILCLEWIGARTHDLSDDDRLTAHLAVLCHDLGKSLTPPEEFPAHRGHETAGLELIPKLLDRLPGLADGNARRMAEAVSRLHLDVRRFDDLRPGTLVDIYDRYFRHDAMRADLFALAVGADVGGRLGREAEGEDVAAKTEADITWLRERCASVDAGELAARFGKNREAFRSALHQARCDALRRDDDDS